MGDGVFNVARGRVAELANNVNNNTPASALFRVILFKTGDSDANLQDFATVAAIIAGASVEADFASYARQDITDTQTAGGVVDQGNDRMEVDCDDLVWSAATTGQAIARLVFAYDDSGSDSDAVLIPLTFHDFIVTTNGNDLTAQIDALGFYRAA